MKKKVLVIGLGYIGSAIYSKLQNLYHIDTCDFNNDEATFKMDHDDLYGEIGNYDVIVYLAGNSSVGSCYIVDDTINNNVLKFQRFLDKVAQWNDRRSEGIKVIYASSASVYGTGLGINPMNVTSKEYHPLRTPINLYDASKQIGDIISNMYSNQIELYGLRFGTVNGYSPKMRWDLIINAMYKSAMETGKILVTNPNIHRAILFIDDLVNSIKAIIDNEDSSRHGIYNIASFNDSIGNIAEYVAESIGKPIEFTTNFTTATYDFCIDCDKFNNNISPLLSRRTSSQTIELIIKSLKNER